MKSKEVQQKLLKNGQHRRTITRGKVTQCIQLSRSQKQSAESKRCSAPYPTNLARTANKVVESQLLLFIIAQINWLLKMSLRKYSNNNYDS